MSRFIDDLRADSRLERPESVPVTSPHWLKARESFTTALMGDLPIFLIDNIADYIYGGEEIKWDIVRDFPNLAPPYTQFWAEFRKPPWGKFLPVASPRSRFGFLITALDPAALVGHYAETQAPSAETRWILQCELCLSFGESYQIRGVRSWKPLGPTPPIYVDISKEGRPVGWFQASYGDKPVPGESAALQLSLNPVLLTLCFLHCKNVRIIDHTADPKLAKRYRERHGGVSPAPYKTLVIEPLKGILEKEGRSGEIGLQKALHICRGHFMDFREGPGLFGKHHGIYWQPMHVRGSKAEGAKATPPEIKVRI